MGTSVSEQLVRIASRPVAPATRARAVLHLRDWLACAAIGAREPAGRRFTRHGQNMPAGPATTLRAGQHDPGYAAFVNGALGNILEMDDIHRSSIVHPGDVVIPATLAAAERDGVSGATLLNAIVGGYEVAIRIGMAAGAAHYRHWYNTATCGIFGAAFGAATILGLDEAAKVSALGLAGMQAGGPWQCRLEPGEGKQLATAHAARAGLMAADLAASGATGPRAILDGPLGMFAAMAPGADAAASLEDPDTGWLIHETSFKPWPACRHSHPVIELALGLREQLGPDPERSGAIESALIQSYRAAVDFCDDPEPDTPHRGRFSLQHAFAATFLRGEPDMDFAGPKMLADPDIAVLRRRVLVREDPAMTSSFPERYPASLTVELTDGHRLELHVATALGDPENPISPSRLAAKHRMLFDAAGVERDQAETLERTLDALPELDNISALTGALRPLAEPDPAFTKGD